MFFAVVAEPLSHAETFYEIIMKRKTVLIWAGLVFAAMLLSGCGKKTAPIPPQAIMPAPIVDLAYQLDERGVDLVWSPPRRTEHGDRLPAIDKFLIERAEYEISGFCEDCPVAYRQVANVAGEGPDRRVNYRDEQLRPGHIYFYRVRTGLGWRVASRPSEPVSFRWQVPMAPPVGLVGRAGEQQISLSWAPPVGAFNGGPVIEPIAYQVYRSVAGRGFMPLGGPLTAPGFIDQPVENGLTYRYKVRAVRASGGTGVFSDQVTVVPLDLTPPPAPQGLTIISTPGGLRLFWNPVAAADLGGYQVMRRSGETDATGDFKVIGQVGAPVTSFIDKTVEEQVTYYYGVRAFDLAVPANEGPLSDEIKKEAE